MTQVFKTTSPQRFAAPPISEAKRCRENLAWFQRKVCSSCLFCQSSRQTFGGDHCTSRKNSVCSCMERRARHRKEATMADRVGQHVGNYRLVALLGQGGFAEVYLGQHVRLNLQAAIKVLHTHLTEQEVEH